MYQTSRPLTSSRPSFFVAAITTALALRPNVLQYSTLTARSASISAIKATPCGGSVDGRQRGQDLLQGLAEALTIVVSRGLPRHGFRPEPRHMVPDLRNGILKFGIATE